MTAKKHAKKFSAWGKLGGRPKTKKVTTGELIEEIESLKKELKQRREPLKLGGRPKKKGKKKK